MTTPRTCALPYTDAKPVGAADFYLAINATFRFILNQLGTGGLRRYWTDLGTKYFAPVSARWSADGLAGVAAYWRAFFAAEPGAEVAVGQSEDAVTLDVKVCPAIQHLRAQGREIVPCFCQHCYFINEAIAAPAGFTVRVAGGNGSCRQTFYRRDARHPPQDIASIHEAGAGTTTDLLSRPSGTLSSAPGGGEGRGEEALRFVERGKRAPGRNAGPNIANHAPIPC